MSRLQLGSVVDAAALTIASDLDAATAMGVDYWIPDKHPANGDRVLFEQIQGQLVVHANLTSPRRIVSGTDTVTSAGANTPSSQSISFPSGWFTTAPRVAATAVGTTPGPTGVLEVMVAAVTTSGFDLWVTRGDATATSTVNWIAVGG